MLNQVINNAKQIQAANSGTKIQGAIFQVVKKLTIDECAAIIIETSPDSTRLLKNIERVRNNVEGFTVRTLQDTVASIANASLIQR